MATKKRMRTAAWGLVLLGPVLLSVVACGDGTGATPEDVGEAVRVETAAAELLAVADSIEASGAVEPWLRVSPGTKIMGRVSRVAVREADRVREGQLLATLEDSDLRAAVEQARAGVAMAEARLTNAEAQYRRMTELEGRGSATRKSLEDATSGYDVARASLAKAKADLAAAEVTLAYSEIRSPIDGWVVAKSFEEGDMAAPGRPFFTIEQLERVKVVVRVPESDLIGLASGQPAEVEIDVLRRSFAAEIDRVVPAGDPASRTFAVELILDNEDGAIKSGMFARARFSRGERQALAIPDAALVQRGQLEGVFVVEGERATLRWVKTGRSVDGTVEILSGLEAGETFVLRPPDQLRDGAVIEEG